MIPTGRWGWLFLLLPLVFGCSRQPSFPPNILFIMTDDHAQAAISAYGSTLVRTPHIDRLANEGIRFGNSFVTNSICAPSRAVLLTGKYSHLNGVRDNQDNFDGSQPTFPKLLQQAGYHTAIVGKWHLKTEPQGFDFWNILVGQGAYYNPRMVNMGDTVEYEGYTTRVITDLALEALKNRPADQPFCLLYQHNAPHRNFMPDIASFAGYEEDTIPLPATFFDDYTGRPAAAEADMRVADMYMGFDMKLLPEDYSGYPEGSGGNEDFEIDPVWPNTLARFTPVQRQAWDNHYHPIRRAFRDSRPEGKALTTWKFQRYMSDYLSCIRSVDTQIGRILAYLDQNGLAENTIVVYTSDQGFFLGEHGWYDKRFMYEPSLRTPLIIRYPREIQPGSLASELVLNLDLAPTLLDFAGVAIPSDLQGLSLRPLALGAPPPTWRDAIYYHYYEYPHGWHRVRKHYGIRTDRYKLIHFYEEPAYWEFYDLQEDPGEMDNRYADPEYRDLIEQLKARLSALQNQYEVPE